MKPWIVQLFGTIHHSKWLFTLSEIGAASAFPVVKSSCIIKGIKIKKNNNSAHENNSCAGNKLFSLLARSCPLICSEAKGKHSARSNIRITWTTNDGTSTFSRFSRRKSGDCGKEESRKYESSPREGEREQKALKSSIWYTNWPADWHLTVRGTKCPRGKKGPEGRLKSQLSLGTHYQRLELW